MRAISILTAVLLLMATAAWALTADEVIRLKKAGVSEATIQKMLEAERQGGGGAQGPVTESKGEVIYRAGQDTQEQAQRNAEHERWKEEKALNAAGNVIIDQRSNSGTK